MLCRDAAVMQDNIAVAGVFADNVIFAALEVELSTTIGSRENFKKPLGRGEGEINECGGVVPVFENSLFWSLIDFKGIVKCACVAEVG